MIQPPPEQDATSPGPWEDANIVHAIQAVIAGAGIIVGAVLLSALALGAYGIGLFVMTPFLLGLVTAYLANRRVALTGGATFGLVLLAMILGGVMLVLLALEGSLCILLASPLAVLVAWPGSIAGRSLALKRQRPETPLFSLALLPALFTLDAAIPPSVQFDVSQTVDVAAPPDRVWKALTANTPIAVAPGLIGRAGLAYPIRGRLAGRGQGATRIGEFSTGIARERITVWRPGRRLAFVILSQPPAMEEMSPYRRVHAPHVSGYFDTIGTAFDLDPLSGRHTRVTISATHVLRIDPAPYWQPIARWAVARNLSRVLTDIKLKSEAD